jgi:UDP-3-O-[3-hydroxymyristoyl] glucosamine N-acyltransferase
MMADPEFLPRPAAITAERIAAICDGKVAAGDPSTAITRSAPLDQAGPGDLTFLDNPRYLARFRETTASICICAEKHLSAAPATLTVVVARDPYRAMALVMQALYPAATRLEGVFGRTGVSPLAHVDETARLEDDVTVEPGAVIGPRAEIGRGTVVCANAVIGHDVRIGRDGYVGPGVTLQFALIGNRVIIHPGARIGQDGFGFAMGPAGHLKVPQVGRVVIQDDVEIGANTTIDRGSNRDTIVGEGTKIDNAVQIGHNVVVGRHCVLVSQTGIAGSTVLEDFVALGGQAGIAGHLRIGTGAQIAGASSVKDDVPPGARFVGTPAKPIRDWMREQAALRRVAQGSSGDDVT